MAALMKYDLIKATNNLYVIQLSKLQAFEKRMRESHG